jgi:hypothetical protein
MSGVANLVPPNISLQRDRVDKVHAPNYSGRFWLSVRAPRVRRPPAELGR